jgi:mRNA interferase RelE/StbE
VTEAYELQLLPPAIRAIERHLPEAVATAVVEFLDGGLRENPRWVGKPLKFDLSGLWSARRGEYRVVYEIGDELLLIRVLQIDHRRDVYRRMP